MYICDFFFLRLIPHIASRFPPLPIIPISLLQSPGIHRTQHVLMLGPWGSSALSLLNRNPLSHSLRPSTIIHLHQVTVPPQFNFVYDVCFYFHHFPYPVVSYVVEPRYQAAPSPEIHFHRKQSLRFPLINFPRLGTIGCNTFYDCVIY